jgi:hypothetical protein
MRIPPRPGPGWTFNAPPDWPPSPQGWEPTEGWGGPDSSWPPAPPYWSWWIEPLAGIAMSGRGSAEAATELAPSANVSSLISRFGAPFSAPDPGRVPKWAFAGIPIALGIAAMAFALNMPANSAPTSDSEVIDDPSKPGPNATVVVDKDFTPATTRTETDWVDGDCTIVTSWGNCYSRRKVPVHHRVPVSERYFLSIRRGDSAATTRTQVDAYTYQNCAPGDAWPTCRDH